MTVRPILAVTGGTGFVGRHLVRQAAEAGWEVRALTRRRQPQTGNVEWIDGALENRAALAHLVDGAEAVIHVAGVINAPDRAGFEAGNVHGTLNMVEAAKAAGVRRFIHVSSLAAREPEISAYGRSKARSEAVVAASGLSWTTVRPPAVYGSGDRELLEMFRMAKRGLVALPPAGRLSLIEVSDLNRLFLALVPDEATLAQVLEPDDGRTGGWTHRELAQAFGQAVGRAQVRAVSLPRWALRAGAALDALVRREGAKLTPDRVSYFCHPDWVAAAERRPPPALWRPRVGTFAGLKATAGWYREQGWL